MKTLYNIALTLVIVGALNWLLIGLFKFNLVDTLDILAAKSIMYLNYPLINKVADKYSI